MKNKQIKIEYSSEWVGVRDPKEKYIAEIRHKGLNDFKILKDYGE